MPQKNNNNKNIFRWSDLEQVVDLTKRSNKALEMYECYIRSIIVWFKRVKTYALETFTDMFPYNIHKPFGTSQCVYWLQIMPLECSL